MKLSDFNIANHVHNRWCRFIIHRYLGQFLERNLSLDQLSVDLSKGEVHVQEVNINVHFVNEFFTALKLPLKLIDGFIGEIVIEVPWTKLMSDSTNLRIKDLQLTFQAQECTIDENNIASMLGSVVDKLVSSQELARSFYQDSEQNGEKLEEEEGTDGIKAFTKVIDAIVSRFCMELSDTTIRIENKPAPNSDMCTAIEFRAKRMEFMDEQMKNCRLENRSADTITSQPQGIGAITNLNKYVHLSGVELFTDVFSKIDEVAVGDPSSSLILTSMYIRREKLKQMSPTMSPNESMNADLFTSTMTSVSNFQSCHSSLSPGVQTFTDHFQVTRAIPELLSNPVKFAELSGEKCEIVIRIQNSDTTNENSDYRVDLEVSCKGVNMIITPSQVEILKKFFVSVTLPSDVPSRTELGKRMEKDDYDVIVRAMEDITMQGTSGNRTNAFGGGNWRQQDDFREFDSVNLDDAPRKAANNDGNAANNYASLKGTGRKESTHVKASLGAAVIIISHNDVLSHENVSKLPNRHHDAIDQLHLLSKKFFLSCRQLRINSMTPLHTIREQMDKLYPENHLRLVGSSFVVKYDAEKFSNVEHTKFSLNVTHLDVLEYLTEGSNPLESRSYYPLLDFSEFENPEHEPHLKVIYATSSQNKSETTAQIAIGDCRIELDLSLVDRIADLIAPSPFFDPLYIRSRVDSISRKEMHLSEDLFSNVQPKEPAAATRWKVTSNKMVLDLRVPIADLRNPNASRLPYKQKNVHPEFVRLTLKEPVVDVPVNEDATNVTLSCAELTGEFLGVSDAMRLSEEDLKFLFAASIQKRSVKISFEYDPRNKSLKANAAHMHFPSASEDMTRSFTTSMMQNHAKREGPFSQIRRSFCSPSRQHQENCNEELGDEIIQAGSREEMNQFAEQSMRLSTCIIRLDIPLLRLFIVNHEFLEVLYNRLVNDLALWQPAAPALTQSESDLQINAIGEKFHEYKHDKEDEDDLQEENVHSTAPAFDRAKSHNFCLLMNVGKSTMLMGTKMQQNGAIVGDGQTAMDLVDAQLFTVVGYHADLNRMFFHFSTNTVGIGHRNGTAFEKRGMLSKNISGKEFAKWQRDESQLDCIHKTEQFYCGREKDAFAVALDMYTRPEENVKDVIMAIAVRNTTARLRPFRDTGHLWVLQLIDLFTLQDYEIPGYELPLVTNDIHVHLENVIVAYDHNTVKPDSNSRLRFVIGETHITSSIIASMDVSKFTCIFDKAQLWMSNERVKESVHFEERSQKKDNSFIRVGEIGLLHLEVLNCMLNEEQLHRRRTPLVEVRCKNDIVKIWTCADSLVALINIFTEISESEAFKPIPEEEFIDCEEDEAAIPSGSENDDTRSEAAASTWSRPASTVKPSPNKLPVNVEQKLLAMIGSAVRENPYKPTDTVQVGADALEEFKADFSNNADQDDISLDSDSGRYRMHSLTTDDEFLMVDDGVIGSGITNPDGAPNIKVIGDIDLEEAAIDPLHFRIPDEWRADGLGALQESFPPPLLRYMIRDVSVHIHLYGGSDFAKEEPKPRGYSDEEFRKGVGRGQKVLEEAKGGEHRDHSVAIVLEFNKINFLYQLYNKDAPVMCTNLISVYDFVIKDRLHLSKINELLYQYSNSEQPRRTCAPVLAARIVESHQQEGRLMVSMLPIKINLDQDTFTFIQDFAEDVTTAIKLPNDVVATTANRPMTEVPANIINDRRKNSSLEKPNTLSLEPLTPSPVQPPSPLGDLNYLVNRQSSVDSPVRNPLSDAQLTASAVSIGNLFGTRSSMTNRTSTPESEKPESPDFLTTNFKETVGRTSRDVEESLHLDDHLFDGMEGDWRSQSSAVNYSNLLSDAIKEPDVDDLLSRSTMEGSFHPTYTADATDLVDTSTDYGNIDNDRSTVCDEDEGTEMAASGCVQENDQPMRGTTFFKEFNFSPSATIYLDYHGKNRFSMDKSGAVIGVLKGIGQLNQAEIVLKEIHHHNGLLGVGRCFNHAASEWAEDIKKNLPNVIASCGPISPIVQISKGFMDLFWMPVAEMRKEDGHVVKGIQKGVGSFGLSSAAGIVGIAQSMVGVVQTIAEAVLYEVQPDSAYLNRRNRRIATRQAAPTDLRHGIQLAYGIMSDGVRQTRTDIELAAQEERASGNSGVRSLLRFATPAVLRPLVMGTQMSYQLLGGLRNQLRPDMYQDERHKWRDDEVPGGRG